jgi:hypothetical protein
MMPEITASGGIVIITTRTVVRRTAGVLQVFTVVMEVDVLAWESILMVLPWNAAGMMQGKNTGPQQIILLHTLWLGIQDKPPAVMMTMIVLTD